MKLVIQCQHIVLLIAIILFPFILSAQDNRSQIPKHLQNAYFEVNIGSINYLFGQQQLEQGYSLVGVNVPHTAVRLVLAGYDFNKYLSAQITYMRPVLWVKYKYTDESTQLFSRSVWTNVGGLTIKPRLPINEKFSIYGEAGLGIITRHGFEDAQGNPVVKDANFSTMLFGGGFKYHLSDKWALQVCSNYSPANKKFNQPFTSFVGTGFSYKFSPFTPDRLDKASKLRYLHPKQWLQFGYTSNILGYSVNNAVSRKIPIFWGGEAEVRNGLSFTYQRNIFHGPKVFALDWGLNFSKWQTNVNKDNFFTFSIFPVFRLNYWHAKSFDTYFYYSVAGPSFISKTKLDNHLLGGNFTFQDNMGTGVFFGKKRNINAEIRIGHYSNGNIFVENEAVKIPLSFNLGCAF